MRNSIESIFLFITVLNTAAAEEIYAQVGETVTLKTPHTSEKVDYTQWFYVKKDSPVLAWINSFGGKGFDEKENSIWTKKLSVSLDSLVITNIEEPNFGTFFCKLIRYSNIIKETTYRVTKVEVKMNKEMPLLPGDDLTLTCNVDTRQGEQKPEIKWLDPLKQQRINHGILKIKATAHDSGEWTCVVKNSKEFKISVAVVDFSPSPGPQYASVNSPLFIPFSLSPTLSLEKMKKNIKNVELYFTPKGSSGQTPQKLFYLSQENSFSWDLKENRGLTNASPKSGNFSLRKDKANEYDRGNYTCAITLTNEEILTHTVQVQVLKIIPISGVKLVSGQKLQLSCTLGDHLPPDLEVKWLPPKRRSNFKSNLLSSTDLTIVSAVKEDSGKWKCELWQKSSKTRLASAEITVNIEPLLSVWMLVIICSAGVIVILLLVLAFILYRRQRKRRHLRRRLCQCKNPKPKGFYRT
ncbi:uncharacterized protein LOC133435217 [Cololabis saira]|uniref:uncharacterized protein LOC133435217 n=1 Tax=Cololabis saira TaxID=129043 RepID=UPI002AD3B446|nr:uncharacterized protein LOC133435217 [Cololabis saira]XP_061573100.1 uncharacterized protein LOC133435217 [Cololabis saira]